MSTIVYDAFRIMRAIRAITGLALLPCCAAVTRTFFFVVSRSGAPGGQILPAAVLAVAGGFALWLGAFLFLPRPVRIYVLAHELSHALWGSAMGARVSGIRVSKNGGAVELSEHNCAVALAPYFFPLYTFASILLYYLASLFTDVRGFYFGWLVLIGFTLGFHFSFTLSALSRQQGDIRRCGRLFSYSTIYLLCALQAALLMALLSDSVGIELFMSRLVSDMADAWTWCLSILGAGFELLQ